MACQELTSVSRSWYWGKITWSENCCICIGWAKGLVWPSLFSGGLSVACIDWPFVSIIRQRQVITAIEARIPGLIEVPSIAAALHYSMENNPVITRSAESVNPYSFTRPIYICVCGLDMSVLINKTFYTVVSGFLPQLMLQFVI